MGVRPAAAARIGAEFGIGANSGQSDRLTGVWALRCARLNPLQPGLYTEQQKEAPLLKRAETEATDT